ncbi:MAG: molybdopterin biosynthesis protein, partial [Deltaproteobacteria bacterium]|nr:molybdopterin biosynthesis protein [Deltaproteobacteria bacterium]
MKRNIYLETQAIADAVALVRGALDRNALVQRETVPSHQALGRVLCAPVYARHSSPTVHSAAMDGYALRAAESFAAREGRPVLLEEGASCFAVNTGQPLPGDCDAVIMIEHVHKLADGRISIEAPAFPWQHVRRIGEDIVAAELLFPRNRMLGAYDICALLTGGIWEAPVWERPRLRIIPTGNEVLDFTGRPEPGRGQVVESNSQVLCALASQIGCDISRVPPVPDDPAALREALRKSLDDGMHVTIFCAGSSAGDRDFTRAVIESEGEVLVHGIAAMPGKPTIAGICRGRPVFGAPG